ncbi:MAG: GNAT family N-acetyltransferase [Clostridia bacterium]|nr:GNAT family N-acetyltransferase [Clostridia bacterium]
MYSEAVRVEPAETLADFAAIERIQAETWSPSVVVPANVLMVTVECGGMALVARLGGEVVGFVYALLAYDGRRAWLWSHMAAVRPGFRGLGVGTALKRRQYEIARARGLPLITWTFDPLQAGNANFNLNVLGALVRRFLPNHYGEMDDPLNRGVPSDRFWCEWWVTDAAAPPASPADGEGVEPEVLLAAVPREDGLVVPRVGRALDALRGPSPGGSDGGGSGGALPIHAFRAPEPPPAAADRIAPIRWLVEIPLDYQDMKARDMGLAKEWRAASAEVAQRAFAAGALAVAFRRDRARGVGAYVLVDGGGGAG